VSGSGIVKSGSGWLTSTPAIDHGRFAPGAMVDDRYRIIGLLGRGGMGEVFRADDLRLGQPVALKFLPPSVERDPARLIQFHNEVRTARQVSHPNVCRVYDIGEVDGHHFLTMEYVDGEDLSSLIRRVGRPSEDKALQMARQMCAGLHAAHERGVLHRDLKPANILIDDDGQVRIADFSLAAAAGTVEDIRSGTPAYMAPEQLAGREVTVKSDLYALGLVFYELFTGRRAIEARTVAELMAAHESGSISRPSEFVPSLDSAIERAILRCLDPDPAKRPASALALAASLPGGDPLAAALAAGETPSPEMVAAAGKETAAVSPAMGIALFALFAICLIATVALSDRFALTARVPAMRPTAVLEDRAATLQAALGYATNGDRASGIAVKNDYLTWLAEAREGDSRFAPLATARPATLVYWYRSSPRPLIPWATDGIVTLAQPPFAVTGMVNMILDGQGRLYEFAAVPPQIESLEPRGGAADWTVLFEAAGLDIASFAPAEPDWTPRVFADSRMAWTGVLPELPDTPVRVEAASHLGRPVYFVILGPWARPARMTAAPSTTSAQLVGFAVQAIIMPGLVLVGALLARRNVVRGRGDRRGADRLALFVLALEMAWWFFTAHHVTDLGAEVELFFNAVGAALLQAGITWVFYLALEPYVRKVWPHLLIGWTRLLAGRFRDPLVGRDLLIGAVTGTAWAVGALAYPYVPAVLGLSEFAPPVPAVHVMGGGGELTGYVIKQASNAIQNGAFVVLGLALFRLLLKRQWLVLLAATIFFAFPGASGQFETDLPLVDLGYSALLTGILIVVVLRFGLLASIASFFVYLTVWYVPITFDTTRPFFGAGLFVVAVVAAVPVIGYYLARAGEPLFGKVIED
jgi:serine/threonine-protein kinase